MCVGELISALALCASSWDDESDRLLMLRDVCYLEVGEDYIEINFVDGNAPAMRISKDGKKCYRW